MDWNGFCSGKRGHGPGDCWTKQRDEAGGEGGKGACLASVEGRGCIDDGIGEINGFDIAALDKDEENEWQDVVRQRSRTNSSRLPKSAPTSEQDINVVYGTGLSKGKRERIPIDSGAAESVIPPDLLREVPTRPTSPPTARGCRTSGRSTCGTHDTRVLRGACYRYCKT